MWFSLFFLIYFQQEWEKLATHICFRWEGKLKRNLAIFMHISNVYTFWPSSSAVPLLGIDHFSGTDTYTKACVYKGISIACTFRIGKDLISIGVLHLEPVFWAKISISSHSRCWLLMAYSCTLLQKIVLDWQGLFSSGNGWEVTSQCSPSQHLTYMVGQKPTPFPGAMHAPKPPWDQAEVQID